MRKKEDGSAVRGVLVVVDWYGRMPAHIIFDYLCVCVCACVCVRVCVCVQEMAKNLTSWQPDKLPEKMPALDKLLSVTADTPQIIYVHCEAGSFLHTCCVCQTLVPN